MDTLPNGPNGVTGSVFHRREGQSGALFFVAAADCTGHGVPGAFMSLLGMMLLFDAVKDNPDSAPSKILENVNNRLMEIMQQNKSNTFSGKFGMDIALLKYNPLKKEIEYSGAQNPLLLFRDGQMNEVKADKVSIGTAANVSFAGHTLQVKEGDMLYIYSDGYQDQIGGERKKKFLSANLKETLLQIHTLEPEKQKEELEKKHLQWRGNVPQTDDRLVMGMRI
jgi:serine phosphatase RsbU (regulator of sigma subunit)